LKNYASSTANKFGDSFCAISGFRRDIDEICALRGYYAASSGNALPAFQGNLSFPSSKVNKLLTDLSGQPIYPAFNDQEIGPGQET
jgi:hypothetical protein